MNMLTKYESQDETAVVIMPIMDLKQAAVRRQAIIDLTSSEVMKEGVHYGKIPGTDKRTLYKAGAEMLNSLFGLRNRFEIVQEIEDWTGKDHEGEPLFFYRYRCILYRGQTAVGEGLGSANSREKKHRYRNARPICPNCDEPTIYTSKFEQGGFYCNVKQGGCGSQFADGDERIENQKTGKETNREVFDLVNTLDKMAQKRALVAATLIVLNASEFFSTEQDHTELIEREELREQFSKGDIVDVEGKGNDSVKRGKVVGTNGRFLKVKIEGTIYTVDPARIELVEKREEQQRKINPDEINAGLFGDGDAPMNPHTRTRTPAQTREKRAETAVDEEHDETDVDAQNERVAPNQYTVAETQIAQATTKNEFLRLCVNYIDFFEKVSESRKAFDSLGYAKLSRDSFERVIQYRIMKKYGQLRGAGMSHEQAIENIDETEPLPF